MNVSEAISSRRAIRTYDRDHKLSDADLRALLSAAALAPSSFNMQNRHIVAVLDQGTKDRLQAAAWNQAHVGDASVVLVLAGDLAAHKSTTRYLRNAPADVREMFAGMIPEFYGGKDALQREESCRSVGLAASNLMLRARELGLDTCPMIGFDPAQVSEIVGLDADHPPLMLLVVGKRTADAREHLGRLNFEELVSVDKFGNHAITGEVTEA
jgi:nitroreductase